MYSINTQDCPDQQKHTDWQMALSRLQGAYADGTLRAYKTDIKSFVTWCESAQIEPFPAPPEAVAAFVANQAERCAVSTIKRRLAALVKIHRLLGLNNSIDHQEVVIAVRRAWRAKYSRPHQAQGLTRDLRDKLILANSNGSLTEKRDQAIIAVGYDTLCRRSELVALQVEDLIVSRDGPAQILVRRSKNDPYGKGRLAYISTDSLKLLSNWLENAQIKSGPVFRAVRNNSVGSKGLHPYSINRIIKRAARDAKLPEELIADLSGHSLRVGAAQDMMTSGLDILAIMRAGGWKTTNIVARYIENTDLVNFMKRMS